MAKGKSANPADAFRKAQRKKELKKNKAGRQTARDFALVKKNTRDLEDEISQLESVPEPSPTQKGRLAELKAELTRINKKKEEYVEEHPDQRKLVYASSRRRERRDGEQADEATLVKPELKKRNLFNKNGLPRHPERSIYYDPIMNPYGVAPPGMPYVERPLLPGEVDSDAEPEPEPGESDADDDEIAMPEGPPPGAGDAKPSANSEDEDSDDDIPMPEGPPPPKPSSKVAPPLPPLPPGPAPSMSVFVPPTSHPPLPFLPGAPAPYPPSFPPPPFLAPPGFAAAPPFPPTLPLPPPGMNTFSAPPPPGFFPRRGPSTHATPMLDPLSPLPPKPHQLNASANNPQHHNNPNLPPRPGGPVTGAVPTPPPPPVATIATISAEPELRDLKKEATAFVPSALKRKKAGGSGPGGGRVNAAPSLSKIDQGAVVTAESDATGPQRSDLLGTLRQKFGPMPTAAAETSESAPKRQKTTQSAGKKTGEDDYNKFLSEMGDLLGP